MGSDVDKFELPPNPDKGRPWAQGLFTGEGLEKLDLSQARDFQREQFDLFLPRLPIKRIDHQKTIQDPLRREPQVSWGPGGKRRSPDKAKKYMPIVRYPCYPDHHPDQNLLLKFGMDHPRDAAFTFLDFVLKEDGIDIRVGDVITFENEDFEVQQVQTPTAAYWVNTPFKFYRLCFADRLRTEGDRDDTKVQLS